MKTLIEHQRLRELWRRHRTIIVGLTAAVLTSLAATGWADSLYIITGTDDDTAIVLDLSLIHI